MLFQPKPAIAANWTDGANGTNGTNGTDGENTTNMTDTNASGDGISAVWQEGVRLERVPPDPSWQPRMPRF